MKQLNTVKLFFIFSLLCAVNVSRAQIHPLAFAIANNTNWYANYVGLRFAVTAPAVISGDKAYNAAWSGSTPWGAPITTPLVNVPIIMDSTADSFGCSPFSINMAGKIAVIWRGPIASACEFGYKALQAQISGAKAVVLINEYPGEGPIGMLAGASGGSVTIPVFMIGNLDGIAISGQYRSGVPVTMTITPWGLNNRNDLGFVPQGAAGWHAYAVPKDQIPAGGTMPSPYKMLDGGFIANYGTSDGINVSIAGSLDYTPDATGVTAHLHKDTLSGESVFYGLAHSPSSDSIIAMFTAPEYSFSPAVTGTGRYDINYSIYSDSVDQYPLDNKATISFYTTDSVYSKGRYDFVKKAPICSMFEGIGGTPAPDYVWGDMFYVAHGRDAVRTLQFSISNPANTFGPIAAGFVNLFVFKWVDTGLGDKFVENGELTLVSQGRYNFLPTDTSTMPFTLQYMLDPVTGNPGDHAPWLDSNSWYYVAAEIPGGYFLGCDGGTTNPYPRMYGRLHNGGILEYSNFDWAGDYKTGTNTMISNPNVANFPVAFPEVSTLSDTSMDSVNFANQRGLIPSIAMIITTTPDTSHLHDGVGNISKPYADIKLYPNPASEYLSVSVTLPQTASEVTYTVLDGLGRFVGKQKHNNVLTDNFSIPTTQLAAGNYFLIINADDKMLSRKFTVIK